MKNPNCKCEECRCELDEQTTEDTTTASVAFPPTMMPKRLLRRRKDPRVEEIVAVDKRYNEAKRGGPVLRKRFRKYIENQG